jgi:hypothetical protein
MKRSCDGDNIMPWPAIRSGQRLPVYFPTYLERYIEMRRQVISLVDSTRSLSAHFTDDFQKTTFFTISDQKEEI